MATVNTPANKPLNMDLEKKAIFIPLPSPTFNFAFAVGKRKQVIDSELYTSELLTGNKNLVNTIVPIPDQVRARCGRYWTAGPNLPELGLTPKNQIAFNVAKLTEPSDVQESKTIFGETYQSFSLKAKKELFKLTPGVPPNASTTFNKELWRLFVTDLPPTASSSPTVPITEQLGQNVKLVIDTQPVLQVLSQNQAKSLKGEFTNTKQNLVLNTPITSSARETLAINQNLQKELVANPAQFSQQSTLRFNQPTNERTFTRDAFNLTASFLPGKAIVLPNKTTSTPANFANVIPSIKEGVDYFDHVFELNVPFPKKELDALSNPIGSLFFDIKGNYNFLVNNYETVIKDQNAKETLLPNMYAFISEYHHHPEANEKPTIFKQHITLAGHIPDVFVDVTNAQGEKIFEKDKGEYFDKYASAFGELIRLDAPNQDFLNKKFTNLVAPVTNIDLFKDFNDKAVLFPMYFDISFSTDNVSQFSQMLEDSQLSSFLIKDIIEGNIPVETHSFQETVVESVEQSGSSQTKTFQLNSAKKTLRGWDITDWLQKISSNPIDEFSGLNSGVFLGSLNDEIKMTSNQQYEFIKNLLVLVFAGKMRQLVKDNFRTYDDILKGKSAYSENVFYRIEKVETATGNVLQNIYLPNSSQLDILRFIDTQVKYNKQYTYNIFVYQMVLGNKYNYKMKSVTDDNAEIAVYNTPSIKLIETSYATFTGRVMDNPPVPPDVNIIPYLTVNNQILFNMNTNVGKYKMKPILLEPGDAALITQLREAQNIGTQEFLQFSSNDNAKAFEIFRIDFLPKTYQDFAGKRIALVSTDFPGNFSLQETTAGSFIDNILPNKKYYYTFRAIDTHGHISNPTDIFELEMVDDDGTIYPLIKVVNFDTNEEIKSPTKSAKRFIQIVPTFNQSILNEQKSGLIDNHGNRVSSVKDQKNFYLGVTDEPVWGKNFKVRLTSKRTGKKIDLNVQFIHSFVNRLDKKDTTI